MCGKHGRAEGSNESSQGREIAQGGVIGCIGNFADWKDQLSLLAAIKILKDMGYDIKVRFVGSGPELEKCRAYVKENGLADCVTFEKEVRHEELANFYRALDLFVLPSYHEGFGCVFTEAHSCGVPFITCEGQGMDDLIPTEDREKWLCKQRDPEDLSKKISAYLVNRWEQCLSEDQDIDFLVSKFIDNVGLTLM